MEHVIEIATLRGKLEGWFAEHRSVMAAYSGGVDSALLVAVGQTAMKKNGGRLLACIGTSPSYPERELQGALEVARQVGAEVRIVKTEEHLDPNYAANPGNRCYFCKSELYTRLKTIAAAEGIALIVDGNNASDVGEDRPGWLAGRERGIRSPLAELGITKDEVRALAKEMGLTVWDKPAMPCTSSRVPHGTAIVPGLLKQIEEAEGALLAMGFKELRVRHHGEIARIELRAEDLPRAMEMREKIVGAVKAAGYKFVTLDLAGFKSGGLHEATK
jgi:pyridinium-3,5-biscarboxylic acid mononucleotide sulfurtransferase